MYAYFVTSLPGDGEYHSGSCSARQNREDGTGFLLICLLRLSRAEIQKRYNLYFNSVVGLFSLRQFLKYQKDPHLFSISINL